MDGANQDILIKNEEVGDQSEQNNNKKIPDVAFEKESTSTWSMGKVNRDDPNVESMGATTPGGVPTGLGATSIGGIPTGLGATTLGGIPTVQKKTEIKAEGDLQIVANDGIVNLGDVVNCNGDYVANQQVFFIVQGDQQGKSTPEHEISKGYVDLPCRRIDIGLFRSIKEDSMIQLYSVPAEKHSDCCQLCEEISNHALYSNFDVDKQKCFCSRPKRYSMNIDGWSFDTASTAGKCCDYSYPVGIIILIVCDFLLIMVGLLLLAYLIIVTIIYIIWRAFISCIRCIRRWIMKKVGNRDLDEDNP